VLGGGTFTTVPLNLYSVAGSNLYQNDWNLIVAYVALMSVPLVVHGSSSSRAATEPGAQRTQT
jgi:hypothetical protein